MYHMKNKSTASSISSARHLRVIIVPEAFCKRVVIDLQLRDLKQKRKYGINNVHLCDRRVIIHCIR